MCDTKCECARPTKAKARGKAGESCRVDGLPTEGTPSMRRIMNRIIAAGCLALVYMQFTAGSPQVQFLRDIGAADWHFGIIGAIAPAMLLMQFVSAMWSSRLRRRKRIWIPITVIHRALIIPFALVPWVFPDAPPMLLISGMVGILMCSHGLANTGVPMWFSWMGDLLPHRNLNEYWASRRRTFFALPT